MKTRIRLILIAAAAVVFGAGVFSVSSAQRQFSLLSQAISPASLVPNETAAPIVMKSAFSHSTKEHREGKYASCESCHTMPTQNWATARKDPYPDVKNYPYHPSCFGCHAKDVYSNGGAFCGTCHTEASMRARGGTGVLPFPSKSHAMQFTTIFPHDIHQNLIAKNTNFGVAPGHFILAGFTATATPTPTPDPGPQFYNCAICHRSITQMPKYAPRKITIEQALGTAQADVFVPAPAKPDDPASTQPVPAFFKDSPDSHASCFTCHYQRVKPAAYDCAGCHKLSEPYFEKKGIERYSIKYDHSYKDHANKDCTVCHVRITQNSDVSKMKDADVPF
ncbi:MAG TPA: cytochrome c3 family protein, partial [Pyrinomonadaceae bacterium]|nr:cytochrome c3 family protein [Pyrinomonadaceae bacterium]